MKGISRILLIVSAGLLLISIFVPLWSIDLNAPQYPEGLTMLIYPDGVKGDVDIINGLNHYIGMKTIHNEEFIEFKILPYLIGAFAGLCLIVAILKRRSLLLVLIGLFVIFGIIAMYDFWRWEYDYGHNLDPNAAIIVPGMAYQPPLIGFKQLLNFGAYSLPAIGGWLFIGSGLLMILALIMEYRKPRGLLKVTSLVIVLSSMCFGFASCTDVGMEKIVLNKDHCDYCKMTISNAHFGAEIKTDKGRCYKFDDSICMLDFVKENQDKKVAAYFVHNFNGNNELLDATQGVFVYSKDLESPMKGNLACFKTKQEALQFLQSHYGSLRTWEELTK